jgi:hypothetical protein
VLTLLALIIGFSFAMATSRYDERKALEEAEANDRRTDLDQARLWEAIRAPALARPTPVTALAVAGMNEVLMSRGRTVAAFRNRIPLEAWWLMGAIAISCNILLGFASKSRQRVGGALSVVFPLIGAISFLLIADIDAPRHGLVQVGPENLVDLAQAFRR